MSVGWSIKRHYKEDENFNRIISFYVLRSPVLGASVRGKQLREYGWYKNGATRLAREMRNQASLPEEAWKIVTQKEVMAEVSSFGVAKSINPNRQFAFHTKRSNDNQAEAILYAIRCAFAHGGFSQRTTNGKRYYVLANDHNGKPKGRLLLYESTLLSWIELIERGPKK